LGEDPPNLHTPDRCGFIHIKKGVWDWIWSPTCLLVGSL
jgi:hypothetical protein